MFCASQWASQKSLSLLLLCLIPDLLCISLGSHGCAVCAWEKSSLKNQPPEPWLWWMQRDPHSHQQHHSTMLSSASPGLRGKTSKKIFFIFSVCAYNSFPWVTLLPCYVPTIKASLACWDPAHRNVLLVLLWISLQWICDIFIQTLLFSECSTLTPTLFCILTLASDFLSQQLYFLCSVL